MSTDTSSPYYGVAYNGTGATGGDSLTEDLNIYYNVRSNPLACGSESR
jgi:hypothetical protein